MAISGVHQERCQKKPREDVNQADTRIVKKTTEKD